MTLLKLIGKRLLMIPLSLVVLITLTFLLVELMPGNPAVTIAGSFATPEKIAEIESDLELNRPLAERYAGYVTSALRGDLGTSFFSGQPVTQEIWRRLPATIELVGLALILACVIGLVLGSLGAYYRRTRYDSFSRATITLFQSVPDFLLALLLIFVVYFLWGLAPAPVGRLGFSGVAVDRVTGLLLIDSLMAGRLDVMWEALRHLMLPVLALGIVYSAYFGKTTRSTMAEALASPQVEFARASGLPERKVIYYAFLQARTPIITYAAILFGALVGGAAIIETIFSWQGVGEWALTAILSLDVPVIQGFILVAGFITILIYLLLDILVLVLDPRVQYD